MAPACCMSRRDATSPDGLPSRPAIIPSSMGRKIPQNLFSSSSTVTILSKPTDVEDLMAIFSPNTPSPNKEHALRRHKSSSTSKVTIQDRLLKHISRESAGSKKRLSRASVGQSEEEIERRAELRRIQKKRILEELSADGEYDDDAKILSALPVVPAYSSKRRATWATGDFIQAATTLTPPPLSLRALALLDSHSNKETLFDADIFGSAENGSIPRPLSEPNLIKWSNPGSKAGSPKALSRRHSSAGPMSPCEVHEQDIYLRRRKRSSVATIPASPTLSAKPLPSITEPAMISSWRLSYSLANRAGTLRKLSQSTEETQGSTSPPLPNWTAIPLPIATGARMESSPPASLRPLNRWLHSQGVRSHSQAISTSEYSDNVACHSKAGSDLGGVDGSPDAGQVPHLYEMDISRRLAASRGVWSSLSETPPTSPPLLTQGSLCRRSRTSSSGVHLPPNSIFKLEETNDGSNQSKSSLNLPGSGGKDDHESDSIVYVSAVNSYEASPRHSTYDLKTSVLTRPKELADVLGLSDHKRSRIPVVAGSSPRRGTGSPASLAIPLTHHLSRATFDSSIVTETDSHHQLEAELKVVQSRFAEVEASRIPSTPRSSKFREEFQQGEVLDQSLNLPPPCPATPSTARRRSTKATLARLAKLAVGTYDGSMEKMLGVPVHSIANSPPQRRRSRSPSKSHLSPLQDSDAMGVWGKALSGAKSKDKGAKGSGKKKNIWGTKSSKGIDSSDDGEGATEYDKLMAKKEEVMDDWELEMDRTAQKAKVRSKKITHKRKFLGPDKRFPESWARYPSHDREQRALSAGKEDCVEPHDFAINEVRDSNSLWYQNEAKTHLYHYLGDNHEPPEAKANKGFFRKLEDKFKDQLSKFEDSKQELVLDLTYGRRGSTILSAEAEFPELEMLPIEVMSADEIEKHVQQQLEEEEAAKKREAVRNLREREEADLERKAAELDEIFSGPRRKKKTPESAIHKAKRLAEEAKAKAAEDEALGIKVPKKSKNSKISAKTWEPPGGAAKSPGGTSFMMAAVSENSLQIAETTPVPVVEEEDKLDTAGMDSSALDQQVAARLELKKKMDERRKARGGRRGPVARKRPAEQQATDSSIERTSSPARAMDGMSDDEMMANSGVASSVISIADPRYYADCIAARIFTPTPPPDEDESSERSGCSSWEGRKSSPSLSGPSSNSKLDLTSKRQKYGTWSGKNRYHGTRAAKSPRSVKSFNNIDLKKSTEKFGQETQTERVREGKKSVMAIGGAMAAWNKAEN